jgi:hypothetical protein
MCVACCVGDFDWSSKLIRDFITNGSKRFVYEKMAWRFERANNSEQTQVHSNALARGEWCRVATVLEERLTVAMQVQKIGPSASYEIIYVVSNP